MSRKIFLSTFMTFALIIGTISSTFAAANPFNDMPSNHWAYNAVTFLASKGVITSADGSFYGNKNATRYETASMIAKMFAQTSNVNHSSANPFSDVPAGHWAYDSVVLLAANGIADSPNGDGKFLGNQNITRYELAQMVSSLLIKCNKASNSTLIPFSDVPPGSKAVAIMASSGLMEGYGDGTFRGERNITRYEVASMLAKAYQKIFN